MFRFFGGQSQDVANDDASNHAHPMEQDTLNESQATEIKTLLQDLPLEIIHQIFSYLEFEQLVALIKTCHRLKQCAEEDLLWLDILRSHIPPQDLPSASPCPSLSYRDLFIAHHPYWFLPRNKIWISDDPLVGRLMLCKFDPRRGCIEGYRLLAERGPAPNLRWSYKSSVLIHNFRPQVHLWLDDPVLNLPHDSPEVLHGRQGWWEREIRMSVGRAGHNTAASFLLAKNIPVHYQAPSMALWPPRTIPNMPRVRTESQNKFRGQEHKPQTHDEISQTAFRMRHWSQFFTGLAHVGVRLGEEVSTWSTLDPSLFMPTKRKPYQGIFVGDYAGHGCEFLLVIQTEKAPPRPRRQQPSEYMQAILRAMEDELDHPEDIEPDYNPHNNSAAPATPNLQDDIAHTGALEAIKLTGDPNIPRGEHTFIADDIGPRGLIRIANEHPFRGARVVHSRGHVAARGFVNDEFVPSQLLMINPNRLAQYWVPFGHISFYERIDIDRLLAGVNAPKRRASNHDEDKPEPSKGKIPS